MGEADGFPPHVLGQGVVVIADQNAWGVGVVGVQVCSSTDHCAMSCQCTASVIARGCLLNMCLSFVISNHWRFVVEVKFSAWSYVQTPQKWHPKF